MEAPQEKLRSKRDKSSHGERLTSTVMVAVVFVMIVAVALRLGRPGSQGTCSFEPSSLKAVCMGKGLVSIPSDVSGSVVVLHMGDTTDHGENHFPVLRRGNFTRFKNLRELSLVRCDVEDIQEEPFADLEELSRLDLRYNRIQTISETSFRGLTNLEYLLLSYNPIQVIDNYVFRGIRIQHLEFANNPVLGKVSPRAFAESSVTSLVFNRCNLKTVKPDPWVPLASDLRILQISDNLQPLDIKDEAFKGFQLEKLVLTNDGITSTAFLKHGDHEEINLDRNPLESIKFGNTDRKKQHKNTKRLSLSGTKTSQFSRETFSMLNNLEVLNLSSNNIAALNADFFDDLDRLKVLDLSDNDIVEFVGNFSKVLPDLQVLSLNGNEMETIPASMESFFSQLTNLSLGGNPFHCNCEIKWLIRWLEKNENKHHHHPPLGALECRTPERRNLSQVSEYDLRCRPPTILNATIDADGMTLVCTAEGDPAPVVTWIGPFGDRATTDPPKALRNIFQVKGRMTMVRDGNYTCTADNMVGKDSVVIDTNTIPLNGVKFFNENRQKIYILESPQGFLITAALLGLLGYILRHQ